MMNKGLEVIEAHHLFGLTAEEISVVVHPQSIVHSLVEYCDGSMLAHLGMPDMKAPIGYCLSFPERMDCGVQSLDLARTGQLTFETPATERFPCLAAALNCLERDESLPIILNAANEVAVEAFLQDKISFVRISDIVQDALAAFAGPEVRTIEDVFSLDREVRESLRDRQGL
jgi:1-deoxy-D-xylulose-5-phosphate reductoisomerase